MMRIWVLFVLQCPVSDIVERCRATNALSCIRPLKTVLTREVAAVEAAVTLLKLAFHGDRSSMQMIVGTSTVDNTRDK